MNVQIRTAYIARIISQYVKNVIVQIDFTYKEKIVNFVTVQ